MADLRVYGKVPDFYNLGTWFGQAEQAVPSHVDLTDAVTAKVVEKEKHVDVGFVDPASREIVTSKKRPSRKYSSPSDSSEDDLDSILKGTPVFKKNNG
jgi:hypothetical protein